MNLRKIFGKRMTVAEGLRLPVSRHFYYSTFGVVGRYDNHAHMGTFVCEGFSGSGFFVRNTESHSYLRFVSESKKKLNQNVLTLLLGKEPNFDKEYAAVEKAYATTDNETVKSILSSYLNVINLAKDEEQLQRIVRAIKDKMGNHPSKSLVSVLTHYKSVIAGMERDVRSVQINYSRLLDDTQKADWMKVVDAFHLLVDSRRVWSVFQSDNSQAYQQVFFDMGVFDYIQSPGGTPEMRDHKDTRYYLYPDGIVAARSNTDFMFYTWNDVDLNFNVVDISTLADRPHFNSRQKGHKHGKHTDALSTLYGTSRAQVVGEIRLSAIDARFFVNHTGPAEDFVNAVNEWKAKYPEIAEGIVK